MGGRADRKHLRAGPLLRGRGLDPLCCWSGTRSVFLCVGGRFNFQDLPSWKIPPCPAWMMSFNAPIAPSLFVPAMSAQSVKGPMGLCTLRGETGGGRSSDGQEEEETGSCR